jgi:hypothetical protein
MPDRERPLEEQVVEWLQTHGYPLEMRVASAFRSAGFEISQGAYFGDPATKKARELDVVAWQSWNTGNIHWQLALICECKVAKHKPWVMFTRELRPADTEDEFHYYRTPGSRLGKQLILRFRRSDYAGGGLPIFEFAGRPGYGMQLANIGGVDTRASEQGRDPAFDAAKKVAHAAVLHAASVDTPEYDDSPVGLIVLPVVIIDGQLFGANLNGDNELVVSSMASGVLDWANPVGDKPPTWIRVITEAALADFVTDAVRTVQQLKTEGGFAEAIDQQWTRSREQRDAAR